MIGSPIKVKCRKCGKDAPADQFRLHYTYKMMVCPDCFSGKSNQKPKEEVKPAGPPKPAGWDSEDDYLNKLCKIKKETPTTTFKKIPGSDQVTCTCIHCRFSFKYDPFRKYPSKCPYCDNDIPRMSSFNLL
jgi:Zn finger protein HypA/HybF involved in hydrogenase expression